MSRGDDFGGNILREAHPDEPIGQLMRIQRILQGAWGVTHDLYDRHVSVYDNPLAAEALATLAAASDAYQQAITGAVSRITERWGDFRHHCPHCRANQDRSQPLGDGFLLCGVCHREWLITDLASFGAPLEERSRTHPEP